jgi:hypothetical protein
MMRDSLHADDERIMRAMDDERNSDIQAALRLELEGQRAQDDELGQLKKDVLHHINVTTEQIIDNFANLRHDSFDSNLCHMCGEVHNCNDDCFSDEPASEFNEAREWWVEPPDSSEDAPNSVDDDLSESTDIDDGTEDIAALTQANMKLLTFFNEAKCNYCQTSGPHRTPEYSCQRSHDSTRRPRIPHSNQPTGLSQC